jgi:hypothetical protein
MRRLNRIAVPLILVTTVVLVFAVPATRRTALAWLRREPFYEGRPASYWREQLRGNDEESVKPFLTFGERGVPVLVGALHDPDPFMRWRAALVLCRLGPQAASAVPTLMEHMDDADPQVREATIAALGRVGPAADVAVPALRRLMGERSVCGIHAAMALWRITHDTALVMPALTAGLRGNSGMRYLSLVAFRQMGSEARAGVPALVAARKDRHDYQDPYQVLRTIDPDGRATVANWPVFTSRQGGFSVRLPDTPTRGKHSHATAAGPVTEVWHAAELGPFSYRVTYYSGWPVGVQPGATEEQCLDAVVASGKGGREIVHARKVRPAGKYAGRDVRVTIGEEFPLTVRRERYYWVKGRLYRVTALGEESDSPEAERFLESFRLLND